MNNIPNLEHRLQQQRTLAEAALAFNSTLDLDTTLNQIVQVALQLLGGECAFILLPDDEKNYLQLCAFKSENPRIVVHSSVRFKIAETPPGQVFANNVPNMLKSQIVPELDPVNLVKSLVYMPMRIRNQSVGLLCIYNQFIEQAFSEHDIELLRQLASHAAVSIENAMLYQSSQARSFELALIIDSTEAVNSTLSLSRVLSLIGKNLLKALQAHWCEVIIENKETQTLSTWTIQRSAIWNLDQNPTIETNVLPDFSDVTDQSWEYFDAESAKDLPMLGEARHHLFIPVVMDNQLIGIVQLAYLSEATLDINREVVNNLTNLLAQNIQAGEDNRVLHLAVQISRESSASWCSFWQSDIARNRYMLRVSAGDAVWSREPYPARNIDDFPTFQRSIQQQADYSYTAKDSKAPDDLQAIMTQMQTNVVMVVPLMITDSHRGVVLITHNQREHKFNNQELNLAHALVLQAGNAIQNAQLYQNLEHSLNELRKTQAKLVQTARLSAIGQLAAAVAHQINNPLTTVLGDTELVISDMPPTDRNWESMQAIQRAGLRAHEVVKRLLALSRQQAPNELPDLLDVNATIQNALLLVESTLFRGRVQLVLDLAENLPKAVGIPGQLEDVWLNLVMNARDAIENEATPMIQVTSAYNESSDSVEVRVVDNGPGLRRGDERVLFDAFYTTKPPGKGTGLGLYICQHIVEKCGGEIAIDFSHPQGAMFIVTLLCKQIFKEDEALV